jgi:hypothetical protein
MVKELMCGKMDNVTSVNGKETRGMDKELLGQ